MISIRKALFIIIGISMIFGCVTGFTIAQVKPHIITKIVYKTKIEIVTKTKIIKGPTKIVTVYKNGYAYIGDNPLWNCAGNWYNAYIKLADGGPAGDSSLWSYYCPGIQEPAN